MIITADIFNKLFFHTEVCFFLIKYIVVPFIRGKVYITKS